MRESRRAILTRTCTGLLVGQAGMRGWGRWLLVGLLLGVYVLAAPTRAYACSCLDSTPQEALAAADVVFVGDVAHIVPTWYFSDQTVIFTVSRQWKGVTASTLTITTGKGGGDCGYEFVSGQRYLVYASEYHGELYTGICDPTTSIHHAQGYLRLLGEGQPPPAPGLTSTAANTSPFLTLGAISGLLSARQWEYVWAQQGLAANRILQGFLIGAFLIYRWWHWWRYRS